MTATAVAPSQRYTASRPCPVCGGAASDPRGQGRRCIGYLSDGYARCSRPENAGALAIEGSTSTYVHRLTGNCRCCAIHGAATDVRDSRIIATYDYRSETGALLYQAIRKFPKDFFQRYPSGVNKDNVRRVLYRLPELQNTPLTETVWICEGEKDADNLRGIGCVATTNVCGTGGLGRTQWCDPAFREPLRGRPVVVIADADAKGRPHARMVAAALADVAATVRVLELPGPGKDASDWIASGGSSAALHELAEAAPVESGGISPIRAPLASAAPVSVVPQAAEIVVGPDESRVVDEAIASLARAPELYTRGGALAEVITDDPTTRGLVRGGACARIVTCAEARVREIAARSARWVGADGAGGGRPVHPPQWLVRAVMARGQWRGLRPITGVATAPTVRLDGTILCRDGYDPQTGIYLASTVAVEVADRPSRDDARRAADTLLDVIADFPAGPAAKAAWLSGVVSVVARPAIPGPTPMILVDASVRGAGKSLMVDVASIIATGRSAARMIYSRDDAEVRKVITALALVGDPLVLVDNVTGELGCAALDAALTADTWRDRVLGASEMTTEIPIRMVWWATGNGMSIGADLGRRSLLVRLEPQCERPEERSGWRHPRLVEHASAHRGELLSAALTIVRAYIVADRPDMHLRPMGSYDGWSDLVRSSLVWAGQPDPCSTIADLRAADPRGDALRAAIDRWPADDGEAVTSSDLVARAIGGSPWRAALLEWVPVRGGDLPTTRALGYALRAIRGRIVAGRMIVADRNRTGTARWVRRDIAAGDAGDAGDRTPLRGYDPVTDPIGQTSSASHASPAVDDMRFDVGAAS